MVTGVRFQHPWEKFAFENSRLCPFNFQRGYKSPVSSESLERTRYSAVVARYLSRHWHLIHALPCGVCLVAQRCHCNLEGDTQLLWAWGEATALAEAEEWVIHCPFLLLCFWLSSATACGRAKGEIFILIFRCSHSHLGMCVCVDTTHV